MRAKDAATMRPHAGSLQAGRRLLPAGAAAPVAPGHDDVARLHRAGEGRVQVLQRVRGDLGRVADGVGVFAGEDDVGVDVVAVFPGAAGD